MRFSFLKGKKYVLNFKISGVNCAWLPGGKTFNVSYCTKVFLLQKNVIFGAIHLYNKTKKFEIPAKKPKARKTNPAEDRIICRAIKRNPLLSSH